MDAPRLDSAVGVAHAAPDRPPLLRPLLAFALDALIALLVMLLAALAGGVVWGVARGVELGHAGGAIDAERIGQPGPTVILGIALVATALAALSVYAWRRRATPDERLHSRHMARRPSTWGWAVLAGATAFVASTGLNLIGQRGGIEWLPTNQALIQGAAQQQPWLVWMGAVLLAPMYEELLFRRVLFGRLWAAGYPLWGAVLSAALFALLHEVPGQGGNSLSATALLWLAYGFMGLVFAWVYRRTATLWAPIAAHALNNLIACIVLFATT